MNIFKKTIAIFLVLLLVGGNLLTPAIARAEDVPTPPEAPSAPSAPEAPKTPEAPSAPSAPEAPSAPSAPEAPKTPPSPKQPSDNNAWKPGGSNNNSTPNTSQDSTNNQGVSDSGNSSDTTVNTGDATNNASLSTIGNTNTSANGGGSESGTSAINSNNGAGSSNTSNSATTNDNNTNQGNSAHVANSLDQSATTGGNKTSYNLGNSSLTTGDANVTGTVVTAVNTNVDGVMVSEFNIADDHVGDIVLDFNANCTQGCNGESIAANTGNGAGSSNNATTENATNNTTNQNNDADVSSTLTLTADSGNNDASFNTGGDSSITTGDANVSASAVTFANNNIAGNVIYGVVNIFGDLVGDIILTDEMMQAACGGSCAGSATASNSGNGDNSNNLATTNNTYNDNSFQSNDATISNTILVDAETGENSTSFNTGGNSDIKTGDSNIDVNVLNIANMNLNGGTYWLVLVNQAGNWIGQIMGGPEGSNVAGSPIMQFLVDPITGAITAMTEGNGSGSNNTSTATNTTNNTTNQTNTAVINNELDLTANTGNNTSSFNTNGDSNITTGDANVVANIINFVNNNIIGNGTLVVTLINVFGSWTGDFIAPGQTKQEKQTETAAIGGENLNNSSAQTNESDNNPTNGTVAGSSSSIQQVTAELTKTKIAGAFAGKVFAKVNTDAKNMVKGISSSTTKATDKISINLAWGILLLPVALFLIFRRKLVKFAKALPL